MRLTQSLGAGSVAALCAALLVTAGATQEADDATARLAALQTQLAALEHDVGLLEDTKAIKRLQRAYGYYVDKKLSREIGALFAPTAQFTFDGQIRQGQTASGPEQIAAFLRTRYGGGHEGIAFGDTRLFMIDTPLVTLAPNGREATGRFTRVSRAQAVGNGSRSGRWLLRSSARSATARAASSIVA